jgi:hypothetical protein
MNAAPEHACAALSPPFPAILGGDPAPCPPGLFSSTVARQTDQNNAN